MQHGEICSCYVVKSVHITGISSVEELMGARGGVVVKALRYEPAGRGFDSRWFHWNISVT